MEDFIKSRAKISRYVILSFVKEDISLNNPSSTAKMTHPHLSSLELIQSNHISVESDFYVFYNFNNTVKVVKIKV